MYATCATLATQPAHAAVERNGTAISLHVHLQRQALSSHSAIHWNPVVAHHHHHYMLC